MADNTLTVLFKLNDQMSGPLSNITGALKSLQTLAVGVGAALGVAFGVKALVQLGKDAITAAEQITTLSRQTGISLVNIQKLGAVADAVNMPMTQLSTSFRMLSEHADMAAQGNQHQIEMFKRLGISVRDTNGALKGGEQLFSEFADVIAATKNPTTQMALAIEVLGRSGTLALPMLKLGAEGIRKMGEDAKAAGMIMSKDTVESLNTMGREWSAVSTIVIAQAGKMTAALVEVLPKIVEFINKHADVIMGIVGAIQLVFQYTVNGFRFLSGAIESILGYLNDAFVNFKIHFVEGVRDIIDQITDLFFSLGLTIPQVLIDTSAKLTKWVDNSKKDLKNLNVSYDEMYKQLEAKITALGQDNEKTDGDVKKSTEERTAALKDGTAGLLAYIETMRKMGKEQGSAMKEGARDTLAMTQSITGGLQLAMEDIVARTADWRKAWTNMFDGIEKGISSALDTFILKGGKMKDLMKNIFDSIEQSFVHMLTSMLTQALLKEFLGLFVNSSSSPGAVSNMVNSSDSRFGGGNTAGVFAGNGSGNGGGGGGGLGGLLGGLGGIGGSYLIGSAPTENMGMNEAGQMVGLGTYTQGGLTVGGALAGIGGTLAGLSMEQQAQQGRVNVGRSVAGGALAGLSAGAMIGSVIPGIGTVVGAVVGAVGGAVQGWFSGKSAKKKQQKAEDEAAQAQQEQEAALRAQARKLIMADIRAKYGGGLADISAVTDIGGIMSNGISDATLDQMGGAANINAQSGAIGQSVNNIQVSSPITVNATLSGSYDTQVLAQDLGIQLASSIRSAASGAGI